MRWERATPLSFIPRKLAKKCPVVDQHRYGDIVDTIVVYDGRYYTFSARRSDYYAYEVRPFSRRVRTSEDGR